jgi:hypothetical protein
MDVEALARASGAASSIARAANATGVDFSYLMNAAMRESSFKANAKNPKSTASGMFQFIEQTWLAMVKRHGDKHGLGELANKVRVDHSGRYSVPSNSARREILGLRFDADTAAKLAGELTAENSDYLVRKLGRTPTNAELYAAHVLGAKNAAILAEAALERPDARAASMFPVAAKYNRSLFYGSGGRALNAAEAMARFGSQGVDLSKVDLQYADASPRLKGRLSADEETGDPRVAMMDALMALQAQPIGFASGGFGEGELKDASAQLLMRAFNSAP